MLFAGVHVANQVDPSALGSLATVVLIAIAAPGATLDVEPFGNEIALIVGALDAPHPESTIDTKVNNARAKPWGPGNIRAARLLKLATRVFAADASIHF